MLNMNRYVNLLGERFKHGFGFNLFSLSVGKFNNGEYRVDLSGPGVLSPGTGHWPFFLFKFIGVTGALSGWQANLFGFTFGKVLLPDVNEDGTIAGPDYHKYYLFFSCLNHKDQLLEEIINND